MLLLKCPDQNMASGHKSNVVVVVLAVCIVSIISRCILSYRMANQFKCYPCWIPRIPQLNIFNMKIKNAEYSKGNLITPIFSEFFFQYISLSKVF